MVAALGDDVQALVAQAVEQALAGAVGVDLGHHVGHHGVGLLAPGRELLGLLGLAGQLAEHAVGLRRGLDGGVDVDKGDAGLLGQAVHVLGDAVLGVAHVDDDVGVGGQQGLEVHLALAVELAELGQLGDVVGQVERDILGDVVGHADHEIAHQRDGVDLRQRAGDGDLGHLIGHRDRAARGVRELAGLGGGSFGGVSGRGGGLLRGRLAGLRGGLAAAGEQSREQAESQREHKDLFLHFRVFLLFI